MARPGLVCWQLLGWKPSVTKRSSGCRRPTELKLRLTFGRLRRWNSPGSEEMHWEEAGARVQPVGFALLGCCCKTCLQYPKHLPPFTGGRN